MKTKLCDILLPNIISIIWFWGSLFYTMNLLETYWFIIIGVVGTLAIILYVIFEIIKDIKNSK